MEKLKAKGEPPPLRMPNSLYMMWLLIGDFEYSLFQRCGLEHNFSPSEIKNPQLWAYYGENKCTLGLQTQSQVTNKILNDYKKNALICRFKDFGYNVQLLLDGWTPTWL